MSTRKFITPATLLALPAGVFAVFAGCNIWRGAGKDVEKVGDFTQPRLTTAPLVLTPPLAPLVSGQTVVPQPTLQARTPWQRAI